MPTITSILLYSITGCLSAILTYLINHDLKAGPVKASAILSLIVSGWFLLPAFSYLPNKIPLIVFGASFIGMSNDAVINKKGVCVAGLIFGYIFSNMSVIFNGYGGSLGTGAFLSVLITYGLIYIWKKVIWKDKSKLEVSLKHEEG